MKAIIYSSGSGSFLIYTCFVIDHPRTNIFKKTPIPAATLHDFDLHVTYVFFKNVQFFCFSCGNNMKSDFANKTPKFIHTNCFSNGFISKLYLLDFELTKIN